MKRAVSILSVFLLTLAMACPVFAESPKPIVKTFQIAKGTVKTIDGKIDSEWDVAPWIPVNGRIDPAPASNKDEDIKKVWNHDEAKLKMLWDSKYLYVAIYVDDNELGTFNSGVGSCWAHDGVTIYMWDAEPSVRSQHIDGWSDGKTLEQMNEIKIDSLHYDIFGQLGGNLVAKYGRPVRAAVKTDAAKGIFTMEIKIPFRTEKKAGDGVRFGLTVADYEDAKGTRVAFRSFNSTWWADYYSTAEWAELTFVSTGGSASSSPTGGTSSKAATVSSGNEDSSYSSSESTVSEEPSVSNEDSSINEDSSRHSGSTSSADGDETGAGSGGNNVLVIVIIIVAVVVIAGGLAFFAVKKK